MSGPYLTNGDGSVIQMMARRSHANTAFARTRRSTPGLIIAAPGKYEGSCMRCEEAERVMLEEGEIARPPTCWGKRFLQ